MVITRNKRFIYFTFDTEDEKAYIKELLTRRSSFGNNIKEVCMLFEDEDTGEFYTYFGYLDYILNRINTNVRVINKFKKDDIMIYDENKIRNLPNITLRDYQVKAVIKCLERKYGTVVASVGSGKTAMMASLTNYLNKDTLVICPDSQLVYQNKNKFIDYGLNEEDIGVLTGKDKNIRKITIGTFASIKTYIDNYPDLMSRFKVLLFEESHTSQQSDTGRYIDKFYVDKAEYVLGFTGTLYRYDNVDKSLEDFIMLGLTGKPLFYISIKYLVDNGYLTKPLVYFEAVKKFVHPSIKNWNNVYKRAILKNKDRNNKIINFIKMFDKYDLTSLTLIRDKIHGFNLFENLPEDIRDKTLFVCGNNEIYKYRFGTFERYFISYDELMENFKKPDSDIKHLIATQVFSTGTDMPTLNAVILGFVGKSYVQVIQRIGRVLRLHESKSRVFIIDFFDDSHKYLRNQSNERIKIYKNTGIDIIYNINKLDLELKKQSLKRKLWIKKELGEVLQ